MSSTYYSSKRQFETYGAYRAKLVIDVDKYNTYVKVSWHIYAQMQYKWGVGVGIKMTGADSGSDTGCLSSSQGGSSEWKTAASRSGSATFSRGTSSRKETFKATAYGTAIKGHGAADSGSVSVSHTVTIPALEDYTIRYNDNGGSGGPSNQTKYYGRTLTLSKTRPTRTGYDFVGWGMSSSDTKKNYDPGDKYTANKSDTLYAIWKKKTYTIKYSANGGSNSGNSSQTKVYGTTLKLYEGSYFKRTGYKIVGWGISPSGGVKYRLGGSYTSNSSDTLYAIWEALKYGITYNLKGGKFTSNSSLTATKTYGSDYKIRSDVPVKEGYKFLYWTDSKGIKYKAGDTYKTNQSITLSANWEVSVNWMMVGQFSTKTKQYAVSRMDLTIGTYDYSLPNIPNLYGFIGWSKTQLPVQPYSVDSNKFSKKITVPAGNIPTPQRYIYGVYKDLSPSLIRIIYASVVRVDSNSSFSDYIEAIENNQAFETTATDTDTLFGYIELSDIAKNILSTNIKIIGTNVNDSPNIINKQGNRLYLKWVKTSGVYEAILSYKISISLVDNKQKPIIYTTYLQKTTQILDVTKNGSIYPIILGHDVQLHGTLSDRKTSDSLIRINDDNNIIFGNYNTNAGNTYLVSAKDHKIYLGTSDNKPSNIIGYGNTTINGSMAVNGEITGTGHVKIKGKLYTNGFTGSNDYLGYYRAGSNFNSGSTISVASGGDWKNSGFGFDGVRPGHYIVTASVDYPGVSSIHGVRGIAIGYHPNYGGIIGPSRQLVYYANGYRTRLSTTTTIGPSEYCAIRIYVYQGNNESKTNTGVSVSSRLVRII